MAEQLARPNASANRSHPRPCARIAPREPDDPTAEVHPRLLDRAEIPVDTEHLARFLIGKMLVRVWPAVVASRRIVETEAYRIGDPAGHAYRGITTRNRALFLERGRAYVYLATAFRSCSTSPARRRAWARAS